MAARSTNRFKQKPAVPFGDFMLPILGVIALGIVVVGLRILWGPSSPKSNLIAPHHPSVAQSLTITHETKSDVHAVVQGVTEQEEVNDVVIAQPVQNDGEKTTEAASSVSVSENKNSSAVHKAPAKKQQSPPPAKPEPKKESAPKQTPAPKQASAPKQAPIRAGSIDKSQFVVQCGSYSELPSANSVVASLKKIGFMAVVRKAEVRGKTYFRVIVAGGNDRTVANEVAKKIEEAGYPVLVRVND